jgi:putative restriction endonuclease
MLQPEPSRLKLGDLTMNSRPFGDEEVRTRAFQFLDEAKLRHGERLPYVELTAGFTLRGVRIPLMGPQGIFKPAVLERIPLSITTAPLKEGKRRPYEDELREDGLISYKYRGEDVSHPENDGLRLAMQHQTPLVYFYGLVPSWYLAEYPTFIVGDDPATLTFTVAVDDARMMKPPSSEQVHEEATAARREYVTRTVQQRMHQAGFRERVIAAYEASCAICNLRHEPLLEAAHILSDKHPRGEPWVSNGLALCKLHHAAYDVNILGIRPDYVVEIRGDILTEKDGPMLTHGLQELDGRTLMKVPRSKSKQPNPEFLQIRYEGFRAAG